MAGAITASKLCRPEVDTQEVFSVLRNVWKDKIAVVWTVRDVQEFADTLGLVLDHDEALDVLHAVCREHSAEIGIQWRVIESAIRYRGYDDDAHQKHA